MKTHCKRGHEYTAENTIWNPKGNGVRTRKCRTCAKEHHNSGRDREKEKAARKLARIPALRGRIQALQDELRQLEMDAGRSQPETTTHPQPKE